MNAASSPRSRRQFLRGAGVSVGIPFLSSLATPRGARADVVAERRPRFVEVMTFHGGIRGDNFFPSSEGLSGTEMLFSNHPIRFGAIPARKEGDKVVISKTLQASKDQLTDRLLSKMNIYRGFHTPFRTDHSSAIHLGYFVGGDNADGRGDPNPTIDQFLAWSKSFYRSTAGIAERLMLVGNLDWDPEKSFRWASPETKTGGIVAVRSSRDPVAMWNKLFKGVAAGAPAAPDPNVARAKAITDLVFEDFKRVRDGNLRLSLHDKQRLSDHMEMLSEVQRKVANVASGVACGNIPASSPLPADPAQAMALWTDIIAAAIKCGLTRLACLYSAQAWVRDWKNFPVNNGPWHQEVAHGHNQELLSENVRNLFAGAVLALAKKLDVEESGGTTFLDNSLIFMTNECGEITHTGADYPLLTMGSAAGFFKTGQFVDTRRMTPDARWTHFGSKSGYVGCTYNQMMAMVLQSMGVPRSEFEVNGRQGYGRIVVGPSYSGCLVPDAIASASRVIGAVKA